MSQTLTTDRAAQSADTLEALTRCPGLVGDIVDWIETTARKPNRVLALGAAITVIGTLIGRRVAGPTQSATHLYVLGLGRTGAGKQHPIDCAKELLAAAGASHLIGPGEFTTGSAVSNHVEENPLSLCCQDEFGSFLKRVNHKNASGWETQVSKIYRELWGNSFRRYDGTRWANRKPEPVHAPALSIFGLSTFSQFYEALKSGDLPNGFVNRFLVLSSDKKYPERDPDSNPWVVPDDLKQALNTLYLWRSTAIDVSMTNRNHIPVADVRTWESDDAKAAYIEFRKSVEARIDQDDNLENFIGRSVEIAVRLATIRAAGRSIGNYEFQVGLSDIDWGIRVARVAGDRLIAEAGDQMTPEPLNHAQAMNKIIETIKGKRPRISRTELLRKVQRHAKQKDLDAIIETLCETKTIVKERVESTSGPAGLYYRMFR